MMKNFDSFGQKQNDAVTEKIHSQKALSGHSYFYELTYNRNSLSNNIIHDNHFASENYAVNKMLSVLIFLMVK